MNGWQFLDNHALLVGFLIFVIILLIRSIYRRHTRMKMVSAHGWPPPHLDADGDFKDEDEDKP